MIDPTFDHVRTTVRVTYTTSRPAHHTLQDIFGGGEMIPANIENVVVREVRTMGWSRSAEQARARALARMER